MSLNEPARRPISSLDSTETSCRCVGDDQLVETAHRVLRVAEQRLDAGPAATLPVVVLEDVLDVAGVRRPEFEAERAEVAIDGAVGEHEDDDDADGDHGEEDAEQLEPEGRRPVQAPDTIEEGARQHLGAQLREPPSWRASAWSAWRRSWSRFSKKLT